MVSEPNFVYMDFVRESFDSPEGDDDKVYLFFSENAMEYDFYSKVAVSRVARVCKVKLTSLLLWFSETLKNKRSVVSSGSQRDAALPACCR